MERFDRLRTLIGTWRGSGSGRFPHVQDFAFGETLRVAERDPAEIALHYEQQIRLVKEHGVRKPSQTKAGLKSTTLKLPAESKPCKGISTGKL